MILVYRWLCRLRYNYASVLVFMYTYVTWSKLYNLNSACITIHAMELNPTVAI